MEFLKQNKRFSARLDGKSIWELDYTCKTEQTESILTTTYTFPCGLQIKNVAKKYDDFGAYEWVNHIENVGTEPTGILSDLWDCDVILPMPYEEPHKNRAYWSDPKTATKICAPLGSNWTTDEFHCDVDAKSRYYRNHLLVDWEKRYECVGGRSSNMQSPFFRVEKEGQGYIFAIGWTGQWNCAIGRTTDTLTFRSKIEDTSFRVLPGESFRTSSIVILPYTGDAVTAQNLWRRLVKNHFSLIGQPKRDAFAPLCASIWGGMKSSSVLSRIEAMKKYQFPFDYVWMDAGWYGEGVEATPDEFEGDWHCHTGDWRVSERIHPNGLADVSRAVHQAGMKFLLWLEPERVIRNTPITETHPDYFLHSDDPENNSYLLDLGNPQAWEYCYETLADLIERLQVDCYRQDFNFDPLPCWRFYDTEDRRGIHEILHINGLYRLWDALLSRFPTLIIDNCASGGKRIDIETSRRSVPLWRSDFQCNANYEIVGAQCHNMSFNTWMPYSGTGSGRVYDPYRIRSAYSAALNMGYAYSEREAYCDTDEKVAFIRKYAQEYLKVRPYFSEDFYPLTAYSDQEDVWYAAQYHRPDHADGIVQVFRRPLAPYETAVYALRGLNAEKTYRFTDADGGAFEVDGATLMKEGLRLTLPERRSAKIYFYCEV